MKDNGSVLSHLSATNKKWLISLITIFLVGIFAITLIKLLHIDGDESILFLWFGFFLFLFSAFIKRNADALLYHLLKIAGIILLLFVIGFRVSSLIVGSMEIPIVLLISSSILYGMQFAFLLINVSGNRQTNIIVYSSYALLICSLIMLIMY